MRFAAPLALAVVVTLALATVLTLAPASDASAQQRRPVALAAHGLFGDELLMPNAISPMIVEARNQTRSLLRGRVVVECSSFTGTRERHEVALDLPAGETRRAMVAPFVPMSVSGPRMVSGPLCVPPSTTMVAPGAAAAIRAASDEEPEGTADER